MLTEYGTDWSGEWEISSYELGTGCGRYWMAWFINMQAILIGAIRRPRRCVRAFARGRRSTGVYHFSSIEPLLKENLGKMRAETTAPAESIAASGWDAFLFALWFLFSFIVNVGPVIGAAFVVAWLAF